MPTLSPLRSGTASPQGITSSKPSGEAHGGSWGSSSRPRSFPSVEGQGLALTLPCKCLFSGHGQRCHPDLCTASWTLPSPGHRWEKEGSRGTLQRKESFLAPGSLQGCLLLQTGCPLTLLQPNSQTRMASSGLPCSAAFPLQDSGFSDLLFLRL